MKTIKLEQNLEFSWHFLSQNKQGRNLEPKDSFFNPTVHDFDSTGSHRFISHDQMVSWRGNGWKGERTETFKRCYYTEL